MSAVLVAALPLTGCAGFQAVMQARMAAFEMKLRPTGPNRTVEACRQDVGRRQPLLGRARSRLYRLARISSTTRARLLVLFAPGSPMSDRAGMRSVRQR